MSVWKDFKAKFLVNRKRTLPYGRRHDKITRERAQIVRSSYQAYMPALAVTLGTPVDTVPTWSSLKEMPEVQGLCRMPLTFLRAKPAAGYQEIFERTARRMMEIDRVTAIRYALAAHLDISVEKLSWNPDDYPATTYDKSFLDRVINRFAVGESDYLTYHEALATGHSAWAVSEMTRAAWRRAIAHVLRAAAVQETECSLDKLDALGAGFRWANAPPGYKGRAYTWRRMVSCATL